MGLTAMAARGRVVFREIPHFPYLLLPPNHKAPRSELNYESYESPWHAATAITEAFIPYYVARIGAANYRDEVTGRFSVWTPPGIC